MIRDRECGEKTKKSCFLKAVSLEVTGVSIRSECNCFYAFAYMAPRMNNLLYWKSDEFSLVQGALDLNHLKSLTNYDYLEYKHIVDFFFHHNRCVYFVKLKGGI